jgi:hypothetical protein
MRIALVALFTTLLLDSAALRAQQPDTPAVLLGNGPNAIVFGLLGNAPLVSLSYHRQIVQFKNREGQLVGFLDAGAGVGLELTELGIFGGTDRFGPTFPHSATLNLGRHKHFFEVGYGGVLTGGTLADRPYIFTPLLGWRYKSTKGFLMRLHLCLWLLGEKELLPLYDQNQQVVGLESRMATRGRMLFGVSLGKAF